MAEYRFSVHLPFRGKISFDVDLDEDTSLIDNFAILVDATQGTEDEIPIVITNQMGQEHEVQWTFALTGDEGMEMNLFPDKTMDEQLLPGSEIIVEDESNVGALMDMSNHERFVFDCRKLNRFVKLNSDYLKIVKSSRAQIDIQISGVRTVVDIDDARNPVYGDEHFLRIMIPSTYPYAGPTLVPLSKFWHPNISPTNVCYTDGYIPTGEDTFSYIIFQWLRMVQYRAKGVNLNDDHGYQNKAATLWFEERIKDAESLFPVQPLVQFKWA